MKYLPLVCALLAYAIPQCQPTDFANKDESIILSAITDTAGGDGVGNGGSIAFSVGQIFYNVNSDNDYIVYEGIQQPDIENTAAKPALTETKIKLSTYPNPVVDYFIIETSDLKDKNITYKLFDLSGKLIMQSKLIKPKTTVNTYNLQSALYLLYLTEDGQHMKTVKILKR
ncbi:T9SS type A sorting domain-containing protein [Gillisia sp. JM1]|uniref:T9SS type A sorting domain-containing protein n=1 Tax=Gillisia sp. JM1 TaxID=1283286 RepID=UPI0004019B1E|nr:T9SS type A sorting domain-containing protein [Gillisia sp. JM1]